MRQTAPSGVTPSGNAVGGSEPKRSDATAALPADLAPARTPERAVSPPAAPTTNGSSPPSRKEPKQWLAEKQAYKPTADGFPQIIQGDDAETILAIQSFYSSVLGSVQSQPFGQDDGVKCVSDGRDVSVKSKRGTVNASVYEDSVTIGGRAYRAPSTTMIFSALARLLADLGAQFQHEGVRGTRYRNSSYKDVTVTEFSYPPLVVTLSSMSNGTTNPDRLYVLDLLDRKDSLLWQDSPQP